ncbi:LysR substrate-binding domain-containing protein [Vibrio palustris]|uniref:HTH-type transcriptional regulator CynR n=1 Tax=Vibrio palustris TaxID=1918946 RepID=A0A1R4B5I9_9VIBR|nr:LysR substrate-binding domain-containing protein [Vibrio palustris]SJL84175.1 HTH-type transcriptional regulator CynR [Vibrio palustris]
MLSNANITLKMLRYFNEVATQANFSAAAVKLNVTKSPLSAQIKALEAQLGVILLQRDTRNVALTDAGKQLQEECRLIFDVLDTSINRVQQRHRHTQSTINIGVMSSIFWAGFGQAFYEMQQHFATITFNLIELSPEQQKRALQEGRIDIGFVRHADTHNIAPLQATVIFKESMVVALTEHHCLAQHPHISLTQLSQDAFVMLNHTNSASTNLINQRCQLAGFYPNIIQEVTDPNTLLAVVSTRNAVSIVPKSYANLTWPHVTFLPLQETIYADICALTIPQTTQQVSQQTSSIIERCLTQLKQTLGTTYE